LLACPFLCFFDEMCYDRHMKKKQYKGQFPLKATKKNNIDAVTIIGTMQKHKKGFGFVLPESEGGGDIFVPWSGMNGAMNGDRVEVRLFPESPWKPAKEGSREGAVVKILTRGISEVVGTFEKSGKFGFVIPDDKRIGEDLFIPKKYFGGAERGDKVVATITKYPDKQNSGLGNITEIISRKGDTGGDIKSLIRSYGLSETFPLKVDDEALALSTRGILLEDLVGRRDLRSQVVFTIDGADAMDFDDAVSLTTLPNGNALLGVHIADVTHYVTENGPLDKEALSRGTSVYLLNRVVPMLPKSLSNGICSLNPFEDRLTMSVDIELDHLGTVVQSDIYESVIRSNARLIYDDVSDYLELGEPLPGNITSNIPEVLTHMAAVAKTLAARRDSRGSIDFDLDESHIQLDKNGIPVDISIAERRTANRLIEEFMLLANEVVAERFAKMQAPFVYRVHERPSPEKIQELRLFLNGLGMSFPKETDVIRPAMLKATLKQSEGQPFERVVHTVTLRSMQKAMYDVNCTGHFGLALRYYCHFTSPIRRYPDLMIHRIIKAFLHNDWDIKNKRHFQKAAGEAASQSSAREKLSVEIEREAEKMKKAEYMTYHLGEVYPGVISGVGAMGIFVELENTVEGLIRISSLDDDFYDHEPEKHRLIGRRKQKTFTLGDKVTVKVAAADPDERTIDFKLQ
jgi:ribonuclease R